MVNILVRNIDKETVRRLKEKAAAKGTSVNETAREALNASVKSDKAELWAEADRIRAKIGKVRGDSTKLIREDRDSR